MTRSNPSFAARSTDPAAIRRRVEGLERIMEGLFTIPGTRQRVGLDVLMDILPLGGSALAAVIGSYLAWEARNLGMPRSTMVRMAGNIGFDALLGAIPWIGAIPDLFFRSNTRNLRLIKQHLDRHHPSTVTIDR
jgi:hypothetical protein